MQIFVHETNNKTLASHIPLSSIPVQLGGNAEQDVDTSFMENMYRNEEYYEKLASHLLNKPAD